MKKWIAVPRGAELVAVSRKSTNSALVWRFPVLTSSAAYSERVPCRTYSNSYASDRPGHSGSMHSVLYRSRSGGRPARRRDHGVAGRVTNQLNEHRHPDRLKDAAILTVPTALMMIVIPVYIVMGKLVELAMSVR